MEHTIRRAQAQDIPDLLRLYAYMSGRETPAAPEAISAVFAEIAANPNQHLLAARCDGVVRSSVTVSILPSLTHGGRPYAVVEHVVTDPDFGGRGLASALLREAEKAAREAGCYKIMLITSRAGAHVHHLYQKAGCHSEGLTAYANYLDEEKTNI